MDIVLIGAGTMAGHYARVLSHLGERFRCFARSEASAAAFHEATSVRPGTGPLAHQLARTDVRGALAIVAVNVTELAGVCRLLLEHGAARILVEKPGAASLGEMRRLAEVDAARVVRVAYNRRFLLSVRKAAEIVREDGGVQTLHFEFTELPDWVTSLGIHPPEVLSNWTYANSSHVFDLAFHLADAAPDLADVRVAGSAQQGEEPRLGARARFVGCGTIGERALFSFASDWHSGGGWAVELTTPRRRLRLRPLETLTGQDRETFEVYPVDVEPEPDGLKPGLTGMVEDFLQTGGRGLPDMAGQTERIARFAAMTGKPAD